MFSSINMKKIVLWLFIIMVGAFILAGSMFHLSGVNKTLTNIAKTAKHEDINVEKTFSASEIKNIDINTVSTEINVIPTDSNEIKAHFHGAFSSSTGNSAPEFIAEAKGSKLELQIKHKVKISIGVNIENSNLKLDVYVPKTYAESIKASSTSGAMKINGLNLNSLEYNSTSGSLNADSVNIKDTTFNSTSGSMDSKDFGGNLDFTSVSGSLDIKYNTFNNSIKAHTTSGSAKIILPENAQFKVDFNSVSGRLKSDFPITTDDLGNRRSVSGSVGNGSSTIRIDSTSGSAELLKK